MVLYTYAEESETRWQMLRDTRSNICAYAKII